MQFDAKNRPELTTTRQKYSLHQKMALHRLIENLEPREIEVLRLHYWETMSLTEIATVLRIDWQDVKAIFNSAHDKLRSLCLNHQAFRKSPYAIAA